MSNSERRGTYLYAGSERFEKTLLRRRAEREAWFLLPYLEPRDTVLDLGCGPGPITVDLAGRVASGLVVGIDSQRTSLTQAQALRSSAGLRNMHLLQGDCTQLPLRSASFDVVLAQAVMQHLPAPAVALQEIKRVLRPGGLVAVRDADWVGAFLSPANVRLDRALEISLQVFSEYGCVSFARNQKEYLVQAGFCDVIGFSDTRSSGTKESTQRYAEYLIDRLREPTFRRTAITQNYSSERELLEVESELRTWGARADAFANFVHFSAVGRVPESV